MSNKYVVVFKGELMAGHTREQAVARLSAAIKKDQAFVGRLFDGGVKTLSTGLDESSARQFVKACAKLGVKTYVVDLEKMKQYQRARADSQPVAPAAKGKEPRPEPAAESAATAAAATVATAASGAAVDEGGEQGEVVEEIVEESFEEGAGGQEEVVEESAGESFEEGAGGQEEVVEEFVEAEAPGDSSADAVQEDEAAGADIVDGVVMNKSKAVEPKQPADASLDIPSIDPDPEVLAESEVPEARERSYENLMKENPAPKWVVELDVDDTGADALTMSHVGDEIENLEREQGQPLPDVSGLSLAGDEPEKNDS